MLYDTSFIYKKWQKKYSIVERLCSQSKKLVVLYNHFVRRKKWGSRKGVNEIPFANAIRKEIKNRVLKVIFVTK